MGRRRDEKESGKQVHDTIQYWGSRLGLRWSQAICEIDFLHLGGIQIENT